MENTNINPEQLKKISKMLIEIAMRVYEKQKSIDNK